MASVIDQSEFTYDYVPYPAKPAMDTPADADALASHEAAPLPKVKLEATPAAVACKKGRQPSNAAVPKPEEATASTTACTATESADSDQVMCALLGGMVVLCVAGFFFSRRLREPMVQALSRTPSFASQ
mgnify:CR=1 FL=1|tara:strand:+ start:2363 stop:2749 length:387 start_codon:yes stop_codon:yes gene_type:complete